MGKLLRIAVLLCLLLTLVIRAGAAPEGTVTVTLTHEDAPVTKGSLLLYRVASADRVLTPAFSGSGVSLQDVHSADAAEKLASYAQHTGANCQTGTVSAEGTVVFSNLGEGVYLITQGKTTAGYLPIRPFLVCIPESGQYAVEAAPKLEPEPQKPTPPQTGDPFLLALPAAMAAILFSGVGMVLCIYLNRTRMP